MKKAQLMLFKGVGTPMELHEYEIPELKNGEILIKNLYTSICGSDVHTFCGMRTEKTPTVLGHEIVGEIISFADGHDHKDYLGGLLKVGDRVTWSVFSSDSSSDLSKAGMPQKGNKLFKYGHSQVTATEVLHGGLSTHCILKAGTAVLPVPQEVPLPVAAIINCAVATVAGALRMAGELKDKTILITGSGLLGVVCAAMCKSNNARFIHMADIDAGRLELASSFGADELHLLKTSQNKLPNGIDIVFDMSGSADAMEEGLQTLNIGGTAVWIGAVFNTRKVSIDAESIVRRIITIKGLHNYNFDDLIEAVQFISNYHSIFPFAKVVAQEFPLSKTDEAFSYAVSKKPLRVGISLEEKN